MNDPGKIRGGILIFVLAFVSTAAPKSVAEQDTLAWPEIERQHRAWAYSWWMGSAVDAQNITAQLETLQQAGMGGVHIIPIYGAKGYEYRYIGYLTPEWMAMLEHTVREANRLGMGVDMTTGTGWCFGGPGITDELANAHVQHETRSLESGRPLEGHFDNHLQAIIAYAEDGQHVDLTDRVEAAGKISWDVPAGKWQPMTVWQTPMRDVKRAAPGGAARMLNTFHVTLGDLKRLMDELFVSGINHVVFGDCRHSARVSLNGNRIGTLIAKPFHLDLPADALRPTGNVLVVDVTNLAANRIADLDRRGVEWKIFHDINFVNIDYRPFDASLWPVSPSGLLGPVSLQRLQINPSQKQ